MRGSSPGGSERSRSASPADGDGAVVQADGHAVGYGPRRRSVTGLAVRALDERVAALERALRVVRGEREREPLDALARRRRARAGTAPRRRRSAPRPRARRRRVPRGGPRPAPPTARERCQQARSHLAQLLVQPHAVALDVGGRARATAARARAPASSTARRPCASQPRGRAAQPLARARRSGAATAASAACVGVEQETAATSSISVRSVWWPTDAITGTRSMRRRSGTASRRRTRTGRSASRRRARRR